MSKHKELTFEELRAKYAHLTEGQFYQVPEVERWMDAHVTWIGNRDDLVRMVRSGSPNQGKAA